LCLIHILVFTSIARTYNNKSCCINYKITYLDYDVNLDDPLIRYTKGDIGASIRWSKIGDKSNSFTTMVNAGSQMSLYNLNSSFA